jgi:hypothetical protein
MAEKLPGLIDPNLPADQQPLNDTSNPNPVARPPVAIHPDRFTPASGAVPAAHALPDGQGPAAPSPAKKPAAPKAQTDAAPAKPQGDNR